MTPEQQLIFDWIGTVPVLVPNWDKRLHQMYDELNAKWFDKSLPPISNNFVCEFCDMPRDTAGIYMDDKDAAAQSTTWRRCGDRIPIPIELAKISRD
jgi:hypothetical protein